jgi:hypothetical protein
MLFITLGDGHISLSPRLANQPSNRANLTDRAKTTMRASVAARVHFFPSWWGPVGRSRLNPMRTCASQPPSLAPSRPIQRAHVPMWLSYFFHCCLVILLYHQPFCCFELGHLTSLNSTILLQWTQPFYFTELSYFCYIAQSFYDFFASVNSVILWSCQPFCYTELSHFLYSSQISHLSIVLSHFIILSAILLQCSVIIWLCQPLSRSCLSFCYSAKPFSKIAWWFSRLLQW